MKPAARVGDMHTCPMSDGPKPHVGGPVLPPGAPTVFIGGMPAARVGDMAACASAPDCIAMGATSVLIGGMPAARMGDQTVHGGVITLGCPTVLIGDAAEGAGGDSLAAKGAGEGGVKPSAALGKREKDISQAMKDAKALLTQRLDDVKRWDEATRARSKKWFGSDDDAVRKTMQTRIEKQIKKLESFTVKNFSPAEEGEADCYAYVYPAKDDKIYLGKAFDTAPPTGPDSKAGTLTHEMSHYNSVGPTKDHVYGRKNCENLAKESPADAQENADSFEYFVEGD